MQLERIHVIIKDRVERIRLIIDSFSETFKMRVHHIDWATDRIANFLSMSTKIASKTIEKATCYTQLVYLFMTRKHTDYNTTSVKNYLSMQSKMLNINNEIAKIKDTLSMKSSVKHTDISYASVRSRAVRPVTLGDLSGMTLGDLSGKTLGDLSAIDIN